MADTRIPAGAAGRKGRKMAAKRSTNNMNRKEYSAALSALNAQAKFKISQDPCPKRQKFASGIKVYIRPIHETHMLHFDCDRIATVVGTYAQQFGENSPRDWKEYELSIGAWYEECQLMPTFGRSVKECRNDCENFFGKSYSEMKLMRNSASDECPIRKMMDEILQEAHRKAYLEFSSGKVLGGDL